MCLHTHETYANPIKNKFFLFNLFSEKVCLHIIKSCCSKFAEKFRLVTSFFYATFFIKKKEIYLLIKQGRTQT